MKNNEKTTVWKGFVGASVLILVALSGCATHQKAADPLSVATMASLPMKESLPEVVEQKKEQPLGIQLPDKQRANLFYLDDIQSHGERLEAFLESRETFSEEQKIHFLLNSIKRSEVIFVRNGKHYDGKTAAKWLDWKRRHKQYRDDPIVTAKDFVERVADRSKRSGKFYQLRFEDGRYRKVLDVLRHELVALENAISLRKASGDFTRRELQMANQEKAVVKPVTPSLQAR